MVICVVCDSDCCMLVNCCAVSEWKIYRSVILKTSNLIYYQCTPVLSVLGMRCDCRWLNISQVCVTGGHLDHSVDSGALCDGGGGVLTVLLLTSAGRVRTRSV